MKFWGTRRQSPMDSFWNTLTVWHWLRSCEGHQGFWAGTQQNDWHHAATQPLWMWTLQSSKKHHSTDTEQYWGRKLCVLCESIWEAWGFNLQNKLSQLSHRETWKNQSPKKCHQWSSVIISDHQWSSVISDEYTIFLNKWYIYIYIRYLRITPATCCHACPKVPWWQLNQQLSLPAEPHRTAPLRWGLHRGPTGHQLIWHRCQRHLRWRDWKGLKHTSNMNSNMNQTHETIRKYSHPNSKKHNMQMLPCRLSLNLLSLNMSKKPSSWVCVCIYIYSNLPKIKRRFNLTLSLVRILNLFCPFGHYYTIGDISWYKHVSTTLNKMEATKLFYIIFLTVSEKHMKVSRITSSLKLQIHIIWITFINLHHNIQFNHWFLHLH